MKTFDLKEAATFLKMHPEEVRRRAKVGKLPGAKVGRCWVFLELDLAEYIRSLYAEGPQHLRVTLNRELDSCPSTSVVQRGGSILSRPMENEYANLLGLTTKF